MRDIKAIESDIKNTNAYISADEYLYYIKNVKITDIKYISDIKCEIY